MANRSPAGQQLNGRSGSSTASPVFAFLPVSSSEQRRQNMAYKLSKRKPDENLQILHTILYGKKTKAYNLKKNIGQFSGYLSDENEAYNLKKNIGQFSGYLSDENEVNDFHFETSCLLYYFIDMIDCFLILILESLFT
nr:protein DEK-like [Ipomoea batatas]